MNETNEQARERDTKANVALYNAATDYAEYVMSERSSYDEAMKLAGALEDAAVAYAKIAGGQQPEREPTAEAIAGSLQRPGSTCRLDYAIENAKRKAVEELNMLDCHEGDLRKWNIIERAIRGVIAEMSNKVSATEKT